jgi:hypothetical protein
MAAEGMLSDRKRPGLRTFFDLVESGEEIDDADLGGRPLPGGAACKVQCRDERGRTRPGQRS